MADGHAVFEQEVERLRELLNAIKEEPNERVVQIATQSPAGGPNDWLPELYALTDRGNIYRRLDSEWRRVELPWEGGTE